MLEHHRLALLALTLAACDAPPAREPAARTSLFADAPAEQWTLPPRLREISGLATTADGRLFAHDDERAIVYQLDIASGQIQKSFSVGEPTEGGDFEGLAITPSGDFFLATSTGAVLRFREAQDGAHAALQRYDTGLRDTCEVEGLAYLTAEESLILACKTNHARDMRDAVAIYAWAVNGRAPARLWRNLPADAFGARKLHPSSIEIDLLSGRIVLVAAREAALAELSASGEVLSVRRLGRGHRQTEGSAILADGSLMLADEGGDGQARLTRYPRRP